MTTRNPAGRHSRLHRAAHHDRRTAGRPRTGRDGARCRVGGHLDGEPHAHSTDAVSTNGFTGQTVREVLHTSVGGRLLRLRLTNTFGTAPLTVGRVTVALPDGPGTIRPDTTGTRSRRCGGTRRAPSTAPSIR